MLTRLRETFWFVPAMFCVAAAALAQGLIALDRRLPNDIPYITVGASGSRDLLGAIAGSMLTVASTTFSITVAVMALSSSTYGPRLVRNFMSDRGNQIVLGVFVSTFLYALLVLRAVRADEENEDGFVPQVAVSVAVLLAMAAIGVLIYFIHHISDTVQVSSLARRVRTDLFECIDTQYPSTGAGARDVDGAAPPRTIDDLLPDVVPVTSRSFGYVQRIDEDELLQHARRRDLVILLRIRPGDYLVHELEVAVIGPPTRVEDADREAVLDALTIEDSRTPHQDIDFAVQQLEEMAVRALSPSTNDPYTALNALDELSSGLALMAGRPVPDPHRYDDEGQLRVVAPRVPLADLVSRIFDAMRLYAVAHPSVLHRTLLLAERVGSRTQDESVHRCLRENAELLVDAFARTDPQPHDLEPLRARARQLSSPVGSQLRA